MKRRAFVKLLGAFTAAAVANPAVLLREQGALAAAPAAEPVYGLAVYDLAAPARFVYPVLSPMRNQLRRVAGE